MNAQQRVELKILAEKLPLVPEEKFVMKTWGIGILQTDEPGFECGFAGCAIGWAPKLIPNCKLEFVPDSIFPHVLRPSFNGYTGFEAVSVYFGITFSEAVYMFNPDQYFDSCITTKEVSRRILYVLSQKEAEQ